MTRPPTRRSSDPREAAEAALKSVTAKPAAALPPRPAIPNAREAVTLRLDREVLEHFQAQGAGWQERINDALRKMIGK